MDNGRSILLFFFLANLTCFVTFMHRSNNNVMHTKIKANCICRKYKETAENTKKDRIMSSHITKITTSTLEDEILEVEEKKETEAHSCLDRIWYSLNCSTRFDRVIMAEPRDLLFFASREEGRRRRLEDLTQLQTNRTRN